MDLSDISQIEEVPMVLINPKTDDEVEMEEGRPMTIWLVGPNSKESEEYKAELFKQAQAKRKKVISWAEAKRRKIEFAARCTVRFENVFWGGKELEYSDNAAKMLYKEFPWILDQVDAFIGDSTNFLSQAAND